MSSGSGTRSASSSLSPQPDNVIVVRDQHHVLEQQPPFHYHSLEGDPSICIDPGSYTWRAGFSGMDVPYIHRPNVVARYRERKNGRNMMLFGRDVEIDANSRSNGKSMFDGDLLVHSDLLVRSRKAGGRLTTGGGARLQLPHPRH